ncbi:MAG: M1 family metallopeptidase [Saprospiraceae bacterium]|nr:M1 family metallopeptidase [Saprospiraceae bacterium]
MLRFFISSLLSCSLWVGHAQQPYFQQEVNYRIIATLNDTTHTLRATLDLEYINHSPDTLSELWLHLWPNAFRDRNTAYARQALRMNNTRFYFSGTDELGNITGLDFRIAGEAVNWALAPNHPDIAVLTLNKPLLPKQRLRITTPFVLKIPASFSRLGHVGQSYQMTQWYPKPAVYDREGWHAMPYLEMGEFYSEFGSFDLELTLPENYVVMATGELKTDSERAFLEQKVAETHDWLAVTPDSILQNLSEVTTPSSPREKTIHYQAENVHDFAWFADKNFHVQSGSVLLASGKTVKTWTAFTNVEAHLWKNALQYVNRSVAFYSDLVGEYPWPQATAIQSALSAGGGMEYPMITIIGLADNARDLDEVITHEVGHNWFYGVLATNERDHAWMDEGINTYYEQRYMARHYLPAKLAIVPDFLIQGSEMNLWELARLHQERRGMDQPPATPSDDFGLINYWLGAYESPARAFAFLESYLGTAAFDSMMRAYYREWQFKHPQPEDLRKHLETFTGKNLDWFFDGWLYSTGKTDYTFRRLGETDTAFLLRVLNRGRIEMPFNISGIKDGQVVAKQWFEGFEGARDLVFPKGNYDQLTIDAGRGMPEWNRRNNHMRTTGPLKTLEPLRLRFFSGLENDRHTDLNWMPAVGWNHYDKWMAGLVLHNFGIPEQSFEFALAPMYATGSRSLAGSASFRFRFLPKGSKPQQLFIGADARQFHYTDNARENYLLAYTRIMPYVRYTWQRSPSEDRRSSLQWRSIFLSKEVPVFEASDFTGIKNEGSWIHELGFSTERRHPVVPTASQTALEYQAYKDFFGRSHHYLKVSASWQGAYAYASGKRLAMRVFAGGFLDNTRRRGGAIFPGAFNLVSRGPNDYRFDDLYFARDEDQGFFSQQISLRDGGFKTVIENSFNLGRSNNFILALNLKADLPVKLPLNLPLKPYFDIGYFDNAMPTAQDATLKDQLLWSGGFALEFFSNTFGIYFPVVNSQNIRDRFAERGNYWTRISFQIKFQNLGPDALMEKLEP